MSSLRWPKKTAPSKFLNQKQLLNSIGIAVNNMNNWLKKVTDETHFPGSLLRQSAYPTSRKCNEPREPQGAWYLWLELAQLGDNPRSVRVGSPSDCAFGFGWKTEENQAEFRTRLCNSLFLRRQWAIHHLQTIIILDLNVLPCHVFWCLG